MEQKFIKEIGKIDTEKTSLAECMIEMHLAVEELSDPYCAKISNLIETYSKKNPKLNKKEVYYDSRIVWQIGYSNPEFSLLIIVWCEDEKINDEIYDEIKINLSEEEKRYIKKLMWEKLGEIIVGNQMGGIKNGNNSGNDIKGFDGCL